MTTLHIEHAVSDFGNWKSIFDRNEALREQCRVRAYDIHQPIDDAAYVTIRVELDNVDDARALLARLEAAWANRDLTPALRGKPVTRILERKAQRTYPA
jgi:hypothetical protein